MSMHPPPDPDELASDLVDGLLPADQAARLRSDPAIAARVEAIEAARAALRVPPPSPPGAVDRAIAATFAALDGATVGSGGPVTSGERPPPPVTQLRSVGPPMAGSGGHRPAHASRPSRPGSGMPWLAAAAAIVFIGLITIGLISNGSGSDDDASSGDAAVSAAPGDSDSSSAGGSDAGSGESMESSGEEGADAQADGEAATEEPSTLGEDEAAPTTSSAQTTPRNESDLGAVDTPAELADRIRAQRPPGSDTSGGAAASDGLNTQGDPGCTGLTAAGDPQRGEVVYVADAVYAGEPVVVHLYDTGGGELRLVATNSSCADVVDIPYTG